MPIYDVKCLKCNSINELLLYNTSEELKCPECGSTKVEKLTSVTSSIVEVLQTNQIVKGQGHVEEIFQSKKYSK